MSKSDAGKGDKPRNCFSKEFKDNYDSIDWSINPIKKTSAVWLNSDKYSDVRVIEPDGWDKDDWEFSFYKEEITETEFTWRLIRSKTTLN